MKKAPVFTGSGVAIVTPFTPENEVNFTKLGELIDFQIGNGTDAIIVCGTTGESATMNDAEHKSVIEFSVKHVAGRVPLIAGTGSNDTAYCVALSQEAEALGADGLLLVTPYYNKTTQAGLVRHFEYVADRVNIPMILYSVPSRTGLAIQPQTYRALSEHPNINATKEAGGDFSLIAETAALCGESLNIYSGNDDNIVPIMALGGIGVISVLANVAPRETHDMAQFYLNGRVGESRALQLKYMELIKALFAEVNPIPVKAAMNLMGFGVGSVRMPLTDISEGNLQKLKTAMANAGLIYCSVG